MMRPSHAVQHLVLKRPRASAFVQQGVAAISQQHVFCAASVAATSSSPSSFHHPHHYQRASYFTNTDAMKRDDPYAQLGLQYGDGASTAEIKAAFRKRAAELHPDVNKKDSPAVALRKFQELQKAYTTLVKIHSNLNGISHEKDDEWRVSVWRNGDRIAVDRTDVAGALKKRPVPAVSTVQHLHRSQIGHPSGRGIVSSSRRGGEYLTDGGGNEGASYGSPKVSSSVGRGLNKWVTPKEFKPWNGTTTGKRASDFSKHEQHE